MKRLSSSGVQLLAQLLTFLTPCLNFLRPVFLEPLDEKCQTGETTKFQPASGTVEIKPYMYMTSASLEMATVVNSWLPWEGNVVKEKIIGWVLTGSASERHDVFEKEYRHCGVWS